MVKRGDVYIAQLDPVIGSEQGGIRPVVVVQNDSGNLCSTTVIAAVTGKNKKLYLPTHVKVGSRDIVLWDSSVIMLEQIRTLDKSRLIKYIGRLSQETIHKIDEAFQLMEKLNADLRSLVDSFLGSDFVFATKLLDCLD